MPIEPPEFDPTALQRIQRMVGRKAMNEIVELFLSHAPTEIAGLRRAVRDGATADVARIAHGLRSSAFNVGATRLYERAAVIERTARAAEPDGLADQLADVEGAFELACHRIERFRSESRTPRLVIIDDNADNRLLARALLERRYRVSEFAAGAPALEAMQQDPPDLVLLDISLPEIDGVEVLRRLRQVDSLRKLPVVALTAHGRQDDRRRLLEAGFDEYVAKPITDERQLLEPIERLLPEQ